MTATDHDASDESLMLRYQRGARDAFALLAERYEPLVYNFALRCVRSVALAESITHQSFSTVVRRSTTFNHEMRFAPWLFRIVRGLCRDERALRGLPEYAALDAYAGLRQSAANDSAPDGAAPHARRTPDSSPGAARLGAPRQPVLEEGVESQRLTHRGRAVMSQAVQQAVLEVIDALDEDEREVFLLKEIADLPFDEIALVLDADPQLVRQHMRHALSRLRETIAELDEYALALR